MPVFKYKEMSMRRRYSDFDWLRAELERDSKVTDNICINYRLKVYFCVLQLQFNI